ncbi:uncharacterized protein LOC143268030 [Peromyscus maniculatus bairdii]|uniref:uncharacterized protein LOC143268030 n=1 Tax=Peromyscus maniculatus bairdii TaxID=230844 RepID=UPI003FD3FA26
MDTKWGWDWKKTVFISQEPVVWFRNRTFWKCILQRTIGLLDQIHRRWAPKLAGLDGESWRERNSPATITLSSNLRSGVSVSDVLESSYNCSMDNILRGARSWEPDEESEQHIVS